MSTITAERADQVRAEALSAFLGSEEKERPGEVRVLSDASHVNVAVIPTGSLALDHAISAGGFPRGRIIELFGPEMSGKTSLALSVAANAQKLGENVGFIDAEHALNREHALAMGIDEDHMVVFQPSSGEAAIEMVERMAQSGAFSVIIVDSVAALTPQAEIDASVDAQQMALHARLMSKFMRRVAGLVAESDTMLILINQIRANLGAYGNPETTTGGKAIGFYASLRVEVRSPKSKKIERNGVVVGQTCVATIKKNKVGPPYRSAEYDLYFDEGISPASDILVVGEALGVITRAGASYTDTMTGTRLGVGRDKTVAALAEDDELREALLTEIRLRLTG